MKCFICKQANIKPVTKALCGWKTLLFCSNDCHKIYCNLYSLCKLEVKVEELEQRLKEYKETYK